MLEVHGGLLIWTWITFLLVLFILAKTVWKPLLSMLDERELTIAKSLDDAEAAAEKFRLAGEEFDAKIEEARKEAMTIIGDSKEKAEKIKNDLLIEAQSKAQILLNDAEKKILAEKDKALFEIRTQVADISLEIAEKLIRRNLDDKANRMLIDESLKAVGNRNEA
ncbi:MAG: F0F1 ATP synthase subunit B [Candidatus Marinimicrobia bacterium]|nr:F0F1 ATP synthase subunit B [Candidatus Neomarinimicrobiota bacterium]